MPRRPLPLVFACATALAAWGDEGPSLKLDRQLRPGPPRMERDAVKFLSADLITSSEPRTITATGNVMLRQRGAAIRADRLDYAEDTETAVATGNVRLERTGDAATGPRLVYNLGEETGEMQGPVFEIPKRPDRRSASRGSAIRALLEPDEKSRFFAALYTTCPVPNNDWSLRTSELEIDGSTNIGTAYNAAVHFLGVPILYTPWMTFPINNARKTGFLAPTLGSSGRGGFEFSLPWYWNIAPTQDATITPKLFAKRGVQLGGEYRYLQPRYSGQAEVEYLPRDAITDGDRYFLALRHLQRLPLGLALAVNAQKASDDNYFRDLSTLVPATSQTNLPRDVILAYGDDTWSLSARTIGYQTLQDPLAPVTVPYRQLPQLLATGIRQNFYGFDGQLAAELTNYSHPTLVRGQRFIAYPQFAFPLRTTYGYVTPKAGFNYTRYNLSGNNEAGFPDASRSVPLASVDAGLFFDRPASLGGRSMVQTLEPRLFYLNVPYRDQSQLPNFSTAERDFGINTLFSENRFIGGDRIGDANQITAALTSRLIESDTGIERLKATLGQIYYFDPQRVTLPGGTPSENKKSDLLALVSGQLTPAFWMDAGIEHDVSQNLVQRLDLAARYNPRPGSVLNATYRYTRGQIKQVDFSAQWPIRDGFTAVGRWNWSLADHKLVEGLAGFEYNAGCWEIRAVAHRFITATQQVSTSFQIQLELSGLSRIGINPLETLRQNISGYRRSDEISQ
jgi:LPS-assembly protein